MAHCRSKDTLRGLRKILLLFLHFILFSCWCCCFCFFFLIVLLFYFYFSVLFCIFFLFSFLERALTFQNILLFSNSTEVTFQAQHQELCCSLHITLYSSRNSILFLNIKERESNFICFFPFPHVSFTQEMNFNIFL